MNTNEPEILNHSTEGDGISSSIIKGILSVSPGYMIYLEPVHEYHPETGEKLTVDFVYRLANQRVSEITQQPLDKIIGTQMSHWFPGIYSTGLFDRMARAIETGRPDSFEQPYYADGVEGWYLVTMNPTRDGLFYSAVDITEKKRILEDAARLDNTLSTIFKYTQISLSLLKPIFSPMGLVTDFEVLRANALALFDWGLREPPPYESLLTACPDLRDSTEFEQLTRVVESGIGASFVATWRGGRHLVTAARAEDGIVVSATDLKNDKHQVRQLELINKNLQQSNDDLQNFAFIASHDLQEPLRKIQQFGSIIQHNYGNLLGPEGNDLISRMQAAAIRMSALIRDLLMLSRLTTHQQPFECVDLNQVLTSVLQDLEITLNRSEATIQINPLGTVWADPSQIRQLFQNLLTNALKFVKEGETPVVSIYSQIVAADSRLASLSEGVSYRQLVIQDKGIGFDTVQYGERIFKIFQRLHGRQQYDGTGIGLAVVKRVVERHNGAIVVESEPGQGATFRIFLPLPPMS